MNRKAFVTTLGAAGLGLGLAAGRAPLAQAQEEATPADDTPQLEEFPPLDEMRTELYADFTAALADELGIDNADDVNAAIRIAIMSLIDARVGEGELTAGQGEALKTLVATSDAPLAPGAMFGPPHVFIRGRHGFGHREIHRFPGPGERGEWSIRIEDDVRAEEGQDDESATDEEETSS